MMKLKIVDGMVKIETIDECRYAQHLRRQMTRKKPMDRGPWAPQGRTQRDESIKKYANLGAVAKAL